MHQIPGYIHYSISCGFVTSKIYNNRDDFDIDIINLPFLNGDFSRRQSYEVYIYQLIRFARLCSCVNDLNARNKSFRFCLTSQ